MHSPHHKAPAGLAKLSSLSLALALAFQTQASLAQSAPAPAPESQTPTPTPAARPATRPANTPPAPGPQRQERMEVSGSALNNDDRRESTATKIVVTKEEIAKFGDTNLGDVLKRLPGITLGGAPGRGGGQIRMRGLGGGFTQFLINGEPAPPGFNFAELPPDAIERIEIQRAATADRSTQAIAGSINIVLNRTVTRSQRDFRFGYSARNTLFPSYEVGAQLGDRAGQFSWVLSARIDENRSTNKDYTAEVLRDTAGAVQTVRSGFESQDNKSRGINLIPRLNWNMGPGNSISSESFLRYGQFDNLRTNGTDTLLGALPNYSSGNLRIDGDFTVARTSLVLNRKLEGEAKINARFGLNLFRNQVSAYADAFDINRTLTLINNTTSATQDEGFSASGKYNTLLVEKHSLGIGWDFEQSRRSTQTTQRQTSFNTLPAINLDEDYTARVRRVALFAQDEWDITPQWSMYLGLRWENIRTVANTSVAATAINNASVVSPIMQTLYKVPNTKGDQLRFAITRTFRAPNTNELIPRRFVNNNNSPTTPDSVGNPALKPELAWGIDAAYERYFAEGALISASVFARSINDLIERRTNLVNGRYEASPVNAGKASTYGIELEAKFPLRAVMKDSPNVDLRFNLTRASSKVSSVPGPNNALDRQTPLSVNTGFDWKVDGQFSFGSTFGYVTDRTTRLSLTQFTRANARPTLDAYALYRFNPKSNVRFGVGNALHRDYVTTNDYRDNLFNSSRTFINQTSPTYRLNFELKL